MTRITTSALVGGYLFDSLFYSPDQVQAAVVSDIFIAKNGSPAQNVAKVIEMKYGGIENLIGLDDVVVINPNGQWVRQGGSNCACCMGLIDLILNRPGGFSGEILFVECTQFSNSGYWTTSGAGLDRNGPYSFNGMISYYQNAGHTNVNSVRLRRNIDSPGEWPVVGSALDGQGWVRSEWNSPTSGCLFYLPYPIIRSPYSDRLIDLKNGVYENDTLTPTALKFIKMPNLNNHGDNAQQDYAGVTSATKSFLGITELEGDYRGPFNDGHKNMHTYSDNCHGNTAGQRAFAAGEAAGAWMSLCRRPDVVLTTAEWVGWSDRTGPGATNTKTVGLCEEPTSLDYYMSKYVLWPTHTVQQYFNPDYDISNNTTRQTIEGCISRGYGTAVDNEMAVYTYDFDSPQVNRAAIDQAILRFRKGEITEQEVSDLIDLYNAGGQ